MKLIALLGASSLSLLTKTVFAAVMVLPVSGTNLEPGEVDAIGQMVTQAYQAEIKETTIPPEESAKAVAETGGYQQAAAKLGAREYIYVTAVRLSARIVITATRYGADGAFVQSAKMAASGLDDIEPASDRLAKALIQRETPLDARTRDNVTATEGTEPRRVKSERVAGFKASFIYPLGWSERLAPQVSAGMDLRLEGPMHFVEIGVGFTVPSGNAPGYGGLWSDIGADLYLSHADTAPYLGAGMMPRLMGGAGTESPANLGAYVQGGVMFNRESSTRLYTDVRITQNLLPMQLRTKDYLPTELTVNLGMGF